MDPYNNSNSISSSMSWSEATVPVVLDIQCFTDDNNEFIVKEASVLDVTTGTLLLHHIARPPFDRDHLSDDKLRESYWQTKHCHGLTWNQGDIPYYVLIEKLRACLRHRSTVYVKGLKKKQYVSRHLVEGVVAPPMTLSQINIAPETEIVDMADIGCSSLATIGNLLSISQIRCGHHKSTRHRCALANTSMLRGWLMLSAKEPLRVSGGDTVDNEHFDCA